MQQTPEPQSEVVSVSSLGIRVGEEGDSPAYESEGAAMPQIAPTADEQYKLVIEDARALGNRRETINGMFVSIISLIAGGAGYVFIAYPGSIAGLVIVLAAAVFSFRLCHVWEDALGNYRYLLNYRYQTLKVWEDKYKFPSLRRFYTTEDFLYAPLDAPTELSERMPEKWVGKAGYFVNLYTELPKAARWLFTALAILQIIAFALSQIAPYIGKLPSLLPPLPFSLPF